MANRTLATTDLQGRIEKATKEIAQSYQTGLKEVDELKTKINDLELTITGNGHARTPGNFEQLRSALDALTKLTDSIIAESDRAGEEYRKLEHECEIEGIELLQLSGLKNICEKADGFATDLLCYSLAHFKRKDESNNEFS
jgi:uncharacterized protein YukE